MRIIRWAAATVALAIAAGCGAPSTSSSQGGDQQTGTLRVWLFDEANRPPKERVVGEAVREFEAAHRDVKVDVAYIAVDTRNERFRGAFNDPASAPDVAEYGNTDLADYVAAGGFADIGADVNAWPEGGNISADLLKSVTVDNTVYGIPWYLGVRALYYRTDVFTELGLKPPTTQGELADAAHRIRAAKPDLYGLVVGGKYTYGMLPFLWSAGGEIAVRRGGKYSSAINSPEARAGIRAYTDLFGPANCPPQQCADMTGGKTVEAFAAGKAAMAILGNFSRGAVDAGAARGKYAVLPLPGRTAGSVAPAFAGGNNLGVLRSAQHRTLAVRFLQLLGSRKYQAMFYDATGNLPTLTDVQTELVGRDPFLKPFADTLRAGTRFVPVDPAWGKIDAQAVIPTMLQKIVTGRSTVDQATDEAAAAMNAAFGAS